MVVHNGCVFFPKGKLQAKYKHVAAFFSDLPTNWSPSNEILLKEAVEQFVETADILPVNYRNQFRGHAAFEPFTGRCVILRDNLDFEGMRVLNQSQIDDLINNSWMW
jgi:hypothetical protein